MMDARISEVHLTNFKAFESFRMSFGHGVYLVGPNNAGKSTLISAIRAAAQMLRLAMSKPPDRPAVERGASVVAYSLFAERLGLVDENLRHEFRDVESRVRVKFPSQASITAVWPTSSDGGGEDDAAPYFFLDVPDHRQPRRPKEVREAYPNVGVIPILSPCEMTETGLTEGYVRQNQESRLASRHFRNQLRALQREDDASAGFEAFLAFAAPWVPELEIVELRERLVPGEGCQYDLFYREEGKRSIKEIAWAGDGMQVWLQLLFHLFRLRNAEIVVLDEPDLYLHADLQRRLVRVLEEAHAQVITATHSPEMLAEAPRDAVGWVDKSRRRGIRAPTAGALEDLANSIGSQFNVRLAKALRARTVMFVEGDDMKLIGVLARTIGAQKVAREIGIAVIPLMGFSNWRHIEPFKWLTDEFLTGSVDVVAILDRDYRPARAVSDVEQALDAVGIKCHVWERKELESYLLVPEALGRLSGATDEFLADALTSITEGMKDRVFARSLDEELSGNVAKDRHRVTVTEQFGAAFGKAWEVPAHRLRVCPPKEILSELNRRLAAGGYEPVSARGLARELKSSEIADEFHKVLMEVESRL